MNIFKSVHFEQASVNMQSKNDRNSVYLGKKYIYSFAII